MIAVTTFEMFRQLKSIHNSFRLTAKADSSVVLTHKLQMHILEACEAKIGRAVDLPSALRAWVNFFYYSHLKSEEEMMTLLQDQPVVTQAYRQYQQFNQDERLRALDEAHQRYLHDLATDIEAAEEKGRIEGLVIGVDKGIVIGVDKGRSERDIEIARNMKNDGVATNVITKYTGLSYSEIEQLDI